MLTRLALQILCDYWSLATNYTDKLKLFGMGTPCDPHDEVRLMALSCIGELCRTQSSDDLLALLIGVFDNQNERQLVRETAYRAIGRAMGKSWNELPRASRPFNLVVDIDVSVVTAAKERIGTNRRSSS
jgi:hypothetical protein